MTTTIARTIRDIQIRTQDNEKLKKKRKGNRCKNVRSGRKKRDEEKKRKCIKTQGNRRKNKTRKIAKKHEK